MRGPGGGNIVVAEAADALLLVNGDQPGTGQPLLDQIRARFGGRPVTMLVNTDWHPAHSGLNEPLRKAGATVVAHEYTKQYQQRAGLKAGLPTKTFYTTGTMTFGGETVECQHLGQAHTDGDIYVFFRGANVLVAGDVLSVGHVSDRRLHHRRLAGRPGHGDQDAARSRQRRDADRAGRRAPCRRAPTSRRSTRCSPPCATGS